MLFVRHRLLAFGWLCVAMAVLASCDRAPRTIRIATGTRGGTFLPLGETLARSFARDVPELDFVAIESAGGQASIDMIASGEADLALLSNHVEGSSALRLVAPLYQETLQIVVRRDVGITTVMDLRGRSISIGPEGSGTESIARAVLGHFGLRDEDVRGQNLTLTEAREGLERGELDAAFIVAGMRTPVVDALLSRTDMQLLSLGDPDESGSALEGIRIDAPFFIVSAVPERAYGTQPEQAVGTLNVEALLVCSERLDPSLVYRLTESLFAHKAELVHEQRLLARLDEHFDLSVSPYGLHDGADQYLRRHEPTVLQRYTDQISLFITLAALGWSAVSAFRAARSRRRKNRIEERYGEALAISRRMHAAKGDERAKEIAALHALHDSVLADLAEERLDANEGFTVLQRYLESQLARVEGPSSGGASERSDERPSREAS